MQYKTFASYCCYYDIYILNVTMLLEQYPSLDVINAARDIIATRAMNAAPAEPVDPKEEKDEDPVKKVMVHCYHDVILCYNCYGDFR
jgi:hypothetical protein